MGDEIWHPDYDFVKLPAGDILRNILTADRRNYGKAESELAEDIKLLDDAVILYIEPLQAAYRDVNEWKANKCKRAAMETPSNS